MAGVRGLLSSVRAERAGGGRGVPGARVLRARRAGRCVVGRSATSCAGSRAHAACHTPCAATSARASAAPPRVAGRRRLPVTGRADGRAARAHLRGATALTRAGGGAAPRPRPYRLSARSDRPYPLYKDLFAELISSRVTRVRCVYCGRRVRRLCAGARGRPLFARERAAF